MFAETHRLRQEFGTTHGLYLADEYNVTIQLAYPKLTTWLALVATDVDEDAEVKVTLLGSTDTANLVVSDRRHSVRQGKA